MQSHLEAALLGQGNNINNGVDDDEKDEPDEEIEEVDDFIDEVFKVNDCDGESPQKFNKIVGGSTTSGKVVTLQMLLSADILEPGKGVMTIEYLGQRFIGDLLADGKIQSQETDIIFASPSAWAVACKRFINPVKKSGCGWSSVKYRGRKLDVYKNIWYKKKKDLEDQQLREEQFEEEAIMENIIDVNKNKTTAPYAQQIVVKHNTIANRTFTHDANTMIECVPFSNLGKIQPFLVSLSTSAALLMDFHCHLTKSEVSGYLAGQWDVNAHNLQITRAFPCRNTKADRENGPMVEAEISKTIDKEKLTLVGWYHSHPTTTAAPTLRDVDAQLDYQIRMKGTTDNGYTPCIGFIVSPYNPDSPTLESNIVAYWVIPPPENKPNEYGRPMAMSYSVTQDTSLALSLKEEMEKAVVYYDQQQQDNCELVKFSEVITAIGATTYIDKLKSSLLPKFPRDQSDTILWGYVRELLGCKVEEESVLSIPTVTKSSQILTPVSISPNLMLTSDIANALFSSGKFPNASSLLGLPDPMAHSTLAANNMFLSTNLFKMQELLKPLSASSPICSTKSKQDAHSPKPLKIPTDLKQQQQPSAGIDFSKLAKMDYSHELNLMATASLKNKFDYLTATATTTTESSVAVGKSFSAADLSISSSKTSSMGEFSLDLSRKDDGGERSLKMPKTDYFGLDMSTYSNKTEPLFNATHFSSDLSMNASLTEDNSAYKSSDQPMNLTS